MLLALQTDVHQLPLLSISAGAEVSFMISRAVSLFRLPETFVQDVLRWWSQQQPPPPTLSSPNPFLSDCKVLNAQESLVKKSNGSHFCITQSVELMPPKKQMMSQVSSMLFIKLLLAFMARCVCSSGLESPHMVACGVCGLQDFGHFY
jgi:hypothetical protein